MKTMVLSAVVLVLTLTTGCVSLFGDGAGGKKVWTYNLQQSLARSGGDVAMTMVLDQGCPKDKAVEVTAIIISLIQSDVSRQEIEAGLDAQVALLPLLKGLVDKLKAAVPASIGGTDKIPAGVKDLMVSFLRDGALYGAAMYKDEHKDVKVDANEGVMPETN